MAEKARYWGTVMYPQNMIPDWRDEVARRFQIPFAYCVHNKDKDKKGDPVGEHIHFLAAFSNTTTKKTAETVFRTLEKDGCKAFSLVEQVFSIRGAYDYLIHDTDDARKHGKFQYDKSERITGNCFDIHDYEQISLAEKKRIRSELAMVIIKNKYSNFLDFYAYVMDNYSEEYSDVVETSSAFFERLTKGNYQKQYNSTISNKRE